MKLKIKKYWRITFKRDKNYDTEYFAIVKAKSIEKAVERFYKKYRFNWYEYVSENIIVKIEALEVNVDENI